MSDSELRALTVLGFDELRQGTGGLGSIQRAVTRGVFAGLGLGTRAIGMGATALVGRTDAPALSTTPRGSALIAAVTGLRGDALEAEGSPLCEPMAVRVGGEPVPLDADSLRHAFPDAGSRVVVFVHGLMTTEFSWSIGRREPYGDRLAREIGCTPVYVRYNTGRHISENGRSLSELMERLVDAWPVDVAQVALVGHSMGGLVARSACHYAALDGLRWSEAVRHVFCLGSPHLGADIEKGAFANFLRRRSSGIRDLRQGSLVDEDWRDCDPDALRGAACAEVLLLEGATHCFVSAAITRSERNPLGRLLGDTLVLVPSASGRSRTRRIPFEDEHGMHLGAATHFTLLNHPAVYERLLDWLS